MGDVAEPLTFLSQSQNRVDVLRLLEREGALDRYTIESRVEASRRTVIRALDALTEHGYVEACEEEYRLTAFGSALADSYQSFVADAAIAESLHPLLAHVPDDTFDLDPRHLEDAEVIVATEGSPYATLDRMLALRQDAQQIRELASIIEKKSVDQLARRIQEESISAEIVLSDAAVAAGNDHPEYRESQQQILESERVDLRVHPDELPFLLCIADDTVAIGAIKNTTPFALVVSSEPAVTQWAEQTFERYRDQSEAFQQRR